MTPEREKEIRSLNVQGALPHPIVIRDELLAEIDRLRSLNFCLDKEKLKLIEDKAFLRKERDELLAELDKLRKQVVTFTDFIKELETSG
jgi:uncharacterized coiled-coil DUF342 family protein